MIEDCTLQIDKRKRFPKTKLSKILYFLGAIGLGSSMNGCGPLYPTKRYQIESEYSVSEGILDKYFTESAKRKLRGIPVEVVNAPYHVTTGPVESSRFVSLGPFGVARSTERTSGIARPICPEQKYCGLASLRNGKVSLQLINNPCCVKDKSSLERIMVHEYLHAASFKGLFNMSEFKAVFDEFRENIYAQLSGSRFLVDQEADASSIGNIDYDERMWQERIAALGEQATFDDIRVPERVKIFYSKVLKKYSRFKK